jgi:hypothetical protein
MVTEKPAMPVPQVEDIATYRDAAWLIKRRSRLRVIDREVCRGKYVLEPVMPIHDLEVSTQQAYFFGLIQTRRNVATSYP